MRFIFSRFPSPCGSAPVPRSTVRSSQPRPPSSISRIRCARRGRPRESFPPLSTSRSSPSSGERRCVRSGSLSAATCLSGSYHPSLLPSSPVDRNGGIFPRVLRHSLLQILEAPVLLPHVPKSFSYFDLHVFVPIKTVLCASIYSLFIDRSTLVPSTTTVCSEEKDGAVEFSTRLEYFPRRKKRKGGNPLEDMTVRDAELVSHMMKKEKFTVP